MLSYSTQTARLIMKKLKLMQESVNPAFNPDEEFAKDTCYRDIPSVDNSLFTIARRLILEAKK